MDGLTINKISFFLGKIPGRKQECFYFVEGTNSIPVAYINKQNIAEARRLWGKLITGATVEGK